MQLSRDQFEQLALEQLDTVDRVARTLTRISAEADDLVQETYLRALRSWESFELREFGIKPWLLRILHNLHIARATREKRQPKAIEDEQLQAVPESDTLDPPGGAWEANEDLAHALQQLTPELRTVLTLWAVDELSYKEIADVVGVPIGTVMSRLHRARQKLREILEPAAENSDVAGNSRE
jgi:RNA polymerase sigma-70 factor (ECF subfamily)